MKPYLNAVERSIDLHFRSLDYGNVRLAQSLDRSEHNMHQTIWKMKAGQQSVSEQQSQQWNSRSDLEAQLGALALNRRQKGGGRVFSKEKHSFFDQDSTETDAPPTGAAANNNQSNDSQDRNQSQTSRTHRRVSSSGSIDHSTKNHQSTHDDEDSEDEPSDESDDGVDNLIDYNQDAVERRSSVYLSSRFSQARARRSIIGQQMSHSLQKPEEESKSSAEFSDDIEPARTIRPAARTSLPPRPKTSTRPTHKPGVSVVLPTDLFKSIQEANQTSRLAATEDGNRCSSAIPRASFLQRLRRDREMDAKAAALVDSIRQTHEQTLRRLKYTGQLTSRDGHKPGDKNLFAGLRDKFHTTFSALADLSDDEDGASQQKQAPKSRPSSAPPRPILPSETKSFSRPSTASNQGFNPRTARRLPAAFSMPETEETYIDLMRIIQLPNVQSLCLSATPMDSPPPAEGEVPSCLPIQLDLSATETTSEFSGGFDGAASVNQPTNQPVNPVASQSISISAPSAQRNSIIQPNNIIQSNTLSVFPAPGDRRLSVASASPASDMRKLSVVSNQSRRSSTMNNSSRRSSLMQPDDGSDSDSETERTEPAPVEPSSPPPPQVSVYATQRKTHLRNHFITFLATTEPLLWSAEEMKEEMRRDQHNLKRRPPSSGKYPK